MQTSFETSLSCLWHFAVAQNLRKLSPQTQVFDMLAHQEGSGGHSLVAKGGPGDKEHLLKISVNFINFYPVKKLKFQPLRVSPSPAS